jgi:membrane protease YdiL (CAAX protease family)
LSAAILAPICEELVYRVVLQGWAQARTGPVMSITISTLIFVSIHQRFDWLPLAALAIILGYVYYRRRSLLAVVTIHALFNTTMLTFAILLRKSD